MAVTLARSAVNPLRRGQQYHEIMHLFSAQFSQKNVTPSARYRCRHHMRHLCSISNRAPLDIGVLRDAVRTTLKVRVNDMNRPIVIYEADHNGQQRLVDFALEAEGPKHLEDPYGAVLWPGSLALASYLLTWNLDQEHVVELGCGTGLVSLALAMYGNVRSVLATDYNPLSLQLANKAWVAQSGSVAVTNNEQFSTSLFDIADKSIELPKHATLFVCADVLYHKQIAEATARRVIEAVKLGKRVVVADSHELRGRPYFIAELKSKFPNLRSTSRIVPGQTVIGYRHNLISESSTHLPQPLNVTIFEFSL